jgi:hypothetical protein
MNSRLTWSDGLIISRRVQVGLEKGATTKVDLRFLEARRAAMLSATALFAKSRRVGKGPCDPLVSLIAPHGLPHPANYVLCPTSQRQASDDACRLC